MMCDYIGHEFGAHYPDSVCIDGYLWDADSGDATDDGWLYTNGGELPCPQCNRGAWLDRIGDQHREDAAVKGYEFGWPFSKPGRAKYALRLWWWQLAGWIDGAWQRITVRAILTLALLPAASFADAQHLLLNGFPYDEAAIAQAAQASEMHVVHMDWPMDWKNPTWPAFLEPTDDRPVYLALAPFADRDTFMGTFADYRNYCRKAIAHYRPLYCNLGIEAQDPRFAAWFDALVNGQRVLWWRTTGLRREFPGVKFGASFQADYWNADSPIWKTADWAGVTYYPQLYTTPVDIGAILNSVDIPIALAEVGFMTYGYGEFEDFQPLFVEWVLSMPVEFVLWLAPHDFNGDPPWWNTVGLWRTDGTPKQGAEAWMRSIE